MNKLPDTITGRFAEEDSIIEEMIHYSMQIEATERVKKMIIDSDMKVRKDFLMCLDSKKTRLQARILELYKAMLSFWESP